MSKDYRDTVHLPRTDFQMKAGLPALEPKLLERWRDIGLYRLQREQARGKDKFILHDGPPYANGHLHVGHALNKILKDIINRCQQMLGKDANYVPGWDCHGLPIEWKIEEKYREAGKDKDSVPIVEFRRECREFAEYWIEVQKAEFARMGVVGDWDNPYTTMSYAAEAQIARELMKFVENGLFYRGSKPVMWSPVEKTALAEAEIEYHDHTSTTIYTRFPIRHAFEGHPELIKASIVIWTTTPWTIPGNRAVAVGPDIPYVVIEVTGTPDDSLAKQGEKLVIAEARLEAVLPEIGVTGHKVLKTLKGSDIEGTSCRHPLASQHKDYGKLDPRVLPARFATTEEGTGIVHIAPGHGTDDWELGMLNGLEVPETVGEDGCFLGHVPLFAGKHVYKVNGEVADAIQSAGNLLARGKLRHRYPHSWRSKAPLIFRNTLQWFIKMDRDISVSSNPANHDTLRHLALKAIEATRFVPESGKTRLKDMIETSPDWVISRQRAWGVPIAVFVNRENGSVLNDAEVNRRIIEAIEAEGADAWFISDSSRFLGNNRDPEDYEKVTDILDVWFDSGSTHSFVLETRPDLAWPASLYLEGTDQHRGWFRSSLLESCGTRGRAPYDAVLTHGFLSVEGEKMSKSLGNIIPSDEAIAKHGADVLRLWVVGSDYTADLRVSDDILKYHGDIYRRLRNTLRYLLGNLNNFAADESVEPADMPELERWVLHRLFELDRLLRQACDDYQFHPFFAELHNFCAVDLSAFYFDVRKDSLYCDRPDSRRRRAARTVLDHLFDCLTAWLAPFICFTAEEAWLARHPEGKAEDSVHLRQFPDVPGAWRDDDLGAKWRKLRDVRRAVTGALEIERAAKRIGSSLEAAPVVHTDRQHQKLFDGLDAAELFITSAAAFSDAPPPEGAFRLADVAGVAVQPRKAEGSKCERCWRVLPDVGGDREYPGTCDRCADAVRHRSSVG